MCRDNTIDRIAKTNRHASLRQDLFPRHLFDGNDTLGARVQTDGSCAIRRPDYADQAADALRQLLRFSDDGLSFEQTGELSMNYCYEYLRVNFGEGQV